MSSSNSQSTYSQDLSQTRRLQTATRVARKRQDEVLSEVVSLEVQMGIDRRWSPADTSYMDTVKYISLRKFHRALDHLQKLVIQRLFELHKLNLAGAGMY